MKRNLNKINYPFIHRQMKAMVRKACAIIRREWADLIIEDKASYNPKKSWDCTTNGDKKAQEMYVTEIRKHFPLFGAIAEEKELTIPCTHPEFDMYFTIDPLDGTKAYTRLQAFGIGTMIALVKDGVVVAAAVGDVVSGEIFSFAGEFAGEKEGDVEWLRFGKKIPLNIREDRGLNRQYVILREAPRNMPAIVNKMIGDVKVDGLFKDLDVSGGSIGVSLGRVWKGEVGALISPARPSTPWDDTPVIGISQRCGFIFLRIDEDKKALVEHVPTLPKEISFRDYAMLVVHNTRRDEVKEWLKYHDYKYFLQNGEGAGSFV